MGYPVRKTIAFLLQRLLTQRTATLALCLLVVTIVPRMRTLHTFPFLHPGRSVGRTPTTPFGQVPNKGLETPPTKLVRITRLALHLVSPVKIGVLLVNLLSEKIKEGIFNPPIWVRILMPWPPDKIIVIPTALSPEKHWMTPLVPAFDLEVKTVMPPTPLFPPAYKKRKNA